MYIYSYHMQRFVGRMWSAIKLMQQYWNRSYGGNMISFVEMNGHHFPQFIISNNHTFPTQETTLQQNYRNQQFFEHWQYVTIFQIAKQPTRWLRYFVISSGLGPTSIFHHKFQRIQDTSGKSMFVREFGSCRFLTAVIPPLVPTDPKTF